MNEFTFENCPAKNLSLENMEGEIWRDVVGYDGLYSVSNLGRIKREYRETAKGLRIQAKILKQYAQKNNLFNFLKNPFSKQIPQFKVHFSIENNGVTKYTSSLVCEAFIGIKGKNEVYSKKNKLWWDCRACNLEITSYSDCVNLSYEKGNNTPIKSSHEQNAFKTQFLYKRLNDGMVFTRLELHKEYGNDHIDHLVRTAVKKNSTCRGSKWERIEI